jgi:hypothetical protein
MTDDTTYTRIFVQSCATYKKKLYNTNTYEKEYIVKDQSNF